MATMEERRRAGETYDFGRGGFRGGDLAAYLRRKVARREDVQAHEMELERLRETGLGRRLGVEEAGLGERLATAEAGLGRRQKAGFEFARPLRTAQTGLFGAQTKEATARAGLTGDIRGYAEQVGGYRLEQERQKAKRAGLLTEAFGEEEEEFDLESLLENLKEGKSLGRGLYE